MLCVIAKIDKAARVRLDALCKVAEEFDLPASYLYGHITLVAYLGQEEEKFIKECTAALHGQTAFSVNYSRIELLLPTPSIVASPDMTKELRSIHERLLAVAPSDLNMWSYREYWHPHTTLFYNAEANLQAISERMKESFAPFCAKVSSIEFSKVTDSGYEIIDSIALFDAI